MIKIAGIVITAEEEEAEQVIDTLPAEVVGSMQSCAPSRLSTLSGSSSGTI